MTWKCTYGKTDNMPLQTIQWHTTQTQPTVRVKGHSRKLCMVNLNFFSLVIFLMIWWNRKQTADTHT